MAVVRASQQRTRLINLIQNAKVSFLAEIRLDRSSWTAELDRAVAFHDDRRPASCRSAHYKHVDRRKWAFPIVMHIR